MMCGQGKKNTGKLSYIEAFKGLIEILNSER